MKTIQCVLAALLLFGGAAGALDMSATLGGAEVAPGPGDDDGSGVAVISTGGGELTYNILVSGVDSPTRVYIGQGQAGEQGVELFDLNAAFDFGTASGTIAASAGDLSLLNANPSGFFVEVEVDGVGVLRGQLVSSEPCQEDDHTLCLLGDRFEVKVDFRRPGEAMSRGNAIPFADQTGLIWFNNPSNIELLFKMIDACSLPDFESFWVFFSATTTFEYTVTVRDAQAGEVRTFHNIQGQVAQPVADVRAFETCP